MLDHFSFAVKDYDKSQLFYDESFKILGYKRTVTFTLENNIKGAGYGVESRRPYFWISSVGLDSEDIGKARGVHFAFQAKSVEEVNQWYTKCLALGGTDNGQPGPRPAYHPGYYGAFIIDPSGWRIEAAFHDFKD